MGTGVLVTLQTGLLTAIWTLVDLAIYIALVSWSPLVFNLCSRVCFVRPMACKWHLLERLLKLMLHRHLVFNQSLAKFYTISFMSTLVARPRDHPYTDFTVVNGPQLEGRVRHIPLRGSQCQTFLQKSTANWQFRTAAITLNIEM
jgi:hypothetical protein